MWWVPLATLRDPQLVVESAAQALGADDGLVEHVADRSMLIVFDNFEQVVDAAPDVAALLSSCPNLDLLVTSREPLRVNAEQVYEVPPLAPQEGVGLFLARARAVKPDFEGDESISEICRRLDDLPLALELAAARVTALTPGQILERLSHRLPLLTGGARDLPERQRTLASAIDWSYELLTVPEQQAFARLSAFAGGCTLGDAEHVVDADLDTLQSLVDKSLLRHTDDRFWMLETIREYAVGRLEESGQREELDRRHAEHFLALVETAEPQVREGSKHWLDRLEQEHDNLRVALERLEALGELQLALRIAGAMADLWYHRGHVAEGRRRLESLLLADERATAARGKALNGASRLAVVAGDVSIARQLAEEGLALNRRLGNELGAADSLWRLSYALASDRDFASAQRLLLECIPLYGDLGEEHAAIEAVRDLAWTYEEIGDLARARALYEDGASACAGAGEHTPGGAIARGTCDRRGRRRPGRGGAVAAEGELSDVPRAGRSAGHGGEPLPLRSCSRRGGGSGHGRAAPRGLGRGVRGNRRPSAMAREDERPDAGRDPGGARGACACRGP